MDSDEDEASSSAASSTAAGGRKRNRSGGRLFANDLRHMLYGFGDVAGSADDTLEVVEQVLLDYLSSTASELAGKRGRIQTRDLLFVLRKEPDKLLRVQRLLFMNNELKRIRRDDSEATSASSSSASAPTARGASASAPSGAAAGRADDDNEDDDAQE